MNALRITRAITAAMLCLVAPLAAAQAWPSKPVRMVAVFPPGGSVDQVARVLAQQLSVQLGQTFLVENKGGASGSIGPPKSRALRRTATRSRSCSTLTP
jgi:tripartite-type tricarboxylate transporter receptor subunit TctC